MDKSKLLKQFVNSDDKFLFAKLFDDILKCDKQKEVIFTGFLDPYKLSIFESLFDQILNVDVKYSIFGGFLGSERQMIGLFPSYLNLDYFEFPIQALLLSYNKKYSKKITHRDILGSVIGIGLDRSVIGDIIVNDCEAVIFVKSNIDDYLYLNLQKIASAKVNVSKLNLNNLNIEDKISTTSTITVASMRIDCILSKAFDVSRTKSSEFVKLERVFVNWKAVAGNSRGVCTGDIISIRGLGRIKINEITGQNKKGKIILNITKY